MHVRIVNVEDVEIYRIQCTLCGAVFYALSREEAKRTLVEHLNKYHSKGGMV